MRIDPTILKALHYASILGVIAALTALQSYTDAFGGYGPLVGGACALALAEVRRRHPGAMGTLEVGKTDGLAPAIFDPATPADPGMGFRVGMPIMPDSPESLAFDETLDRARRARDAYTSDLRRIADAAREPALAASLRDSADEMEGRGS